MKNERFKVLAPREGLSIPMPEDRFQLLPKEGRRVRMNPYWDRLELDGEVVEVVEAPAPAPAPEVAGPSSSPSEPSTSESDATDVVSEDAGNADDAELEDEDDATDEVQP